MSIKARLFATISTFLISAMVVLLISIFFLWEYVSKDYGLISAYEVRMTIILFLAGLTIFFIAMVIIMGLMLYTTISSILKPLNGLVYMAGEIKKGNLDVNVEYNSKDEFGKVYVEFDEMRQKLKTSLVQLEREEDVRKDMIISVAHDLKTPVTSILGYSEGLLSGIAKTPEKQEKYIKTIIEKAHVMDRLVNDLYLFSKLDLVKEKFEFNIYSAGEGLYKLVNELYPYQDGFILDMQIDRDINTKIKLDEFQFKRVIQNIVQNSIIHSGIDEPIITFSLKKTDKCVIFKISDNGKGLDDEKCNLIFQRFYQIDASRNSTGSGLGLNISQKIIEEMGGKVWARPAIENNRGLAILIRLPEVLDE